MRWRYIIHVIGILIFLLGLCMMSSLAVGIIFDDNSIFPLFIAVNACLITGLLLFFLTKDKPVDYISPREGIAIVSLSWIATGFFGALPFYFSGEFGSFINSLFESVSGFTTTGASILSNIEGVSKGLLFWRSLIQWLGGMGIIVLSIAILPFIGVGGMQLYKAEVPSPTPDKLKPRIKDTAMILWKVYALMSMAVFILLLLGGIGGFDALCHAFTTMPTGGFSTKNTSIAHFNSVYLDVVFILFMLIAAINFSLHYRLLKGENLAFWRDPECRFFLGIVSVLILLVTFDIYLVIYESFGKALQYASFQVVSIISTTGFGTADYQQWPGMSQVIIFFCLFMGGCAGSTSGGMKCLRIMICIKYCYKELFSLIHPHAVSYVKIGGKIISEDVVRSILGFLALYILLFVVCSVGLSGLGVDLFTAFGAVASAIGNIGPGFGTVGPADNYSAIPEMGKLLLIGCMLMGRLEIYTVIVLLVPEFWRK